MQKIICTILIAGMAIVSFSQSLTEKLDTYCKAAEATGRMHGYVLVKQKDKVLLSSGYGYSNYAEKTKATAQTKYQIGSVTKQFTSKIVLQLADEKQLNLGDKLSAFFPSFPQADKVTVEQLLTHTSGIYNYTNNRKLFDSLKNTTVGREEMIHLIASFPYDFEPGSNWSYSNSGYTLLGYIIEKVTGKSYEENVRERIFSPLNMNQSGLGYRNATGEKATGYYLIQQDTAITAAILDASVPFAAGAIYTTPAELLLWDEFLLKQYTEKADWIKNAWTPRKNHYSLGWFADTIHGNPAMHHGGAIDGFHVQNILLPNDHLIVMVLLNAEMYNTDQVARDLVGIVYEKTIALAEVPKEIILDTTILKQYTGTFEPDPNMKVEVTLVGEKLIFTPDGQPSLQLHPISENLFFFKIMDAKIEFVKDADGKVEKFLFHQGGHTMEARRKQ